MINNMRILGIDYGDVRTGVAITDPLGITAQGLKTINVKIVIGFYYENLKK